MGLKISKMNISKSKAIHKMPTFSPLAVKNLINSHIIDVNSKLSIMNCEGSPLWFAVRCNNEELVKLFLAAGANVNDVCTYLSTTPLHMAAYNHNVVLVQILLEYGANPNVLDKWNYTPLMYSALHYDPSLVSELFIILIKFGANVNFGATLDNNCTVEHVFNLDFPGLPKVFDEYISFSKDPLGPVTGTALHFAVQNPRLPHKCIEILLDAGAVVTKMNLNGQTPVMTALLDTFFDFHSEVQSKIKLLINRTARSEINLRDRRNWNCFHYACERGSLSCMELLIKTGCDTNVAAVDGESPLWILLIRGWKEAAIFMLCNGCEMNHLLRSSRILTMNSEVQVCRYGLMLPIEFAICNKLYDVAKLMVQLGCTVNLQNCFVPSIHESSEKYSDFVSYYQAFLNDQLQLKSLYFICRTVIRRTMNHGIEVKVKTLPLPKAVVAYLCFQS